MDSYFTVDQVSKGLFKDKGSRFLAFAHQVCSEDDVRRIVKQYKMEFYDARHHCYAFVIGPDAKCKRGSDDGEPSNSAGAPILGQIESRKLTNVCVVVIRYFGGKKLGVPGLIHAYKSAASEALDRAKIIKGFVMAEFTFSHPIGRVGEVQQCINKFDFSIIEEEYGEQCTLRIEVKLGDYKRISSAIHHMGYETKLI